MTIVGRYAPSPTGALHLGNLRTALAAWCHTRHQGGRFLLRVEDIDTPRVKPGCEEHQLRDLATLGIDWDEPPWRQSERLDVYRESLDRLSRDGHLFPCFCSRKDLQALASAPHAGEEGPTYPGTCRALPRHEVEERLAAGRQHCLRYAGSDADGFVVRRADGMVSYQLACAIDDALSGVTEVLRGIDLQSSAPRQVALLRALGMTPPAYLHVPLVHGPGGRRLSKRDGDEDLEGLLHRGHSIEAIRSFLAWSLGQCPQGERVTLDELASGWDLARVPPDPFVIQERDIVSFQARP